MCMGGGKGVGGEGGGQGVKYRSAVAAEVQPNFTQKCIPALHATLLEQHR